MVVMRCVECEEGDRLILVVVVNACRCGMMRMIQVEGEGGGFLSTATISAAFQGWMD